MNIDLEVLKTQNELTFTDDGKIYVKPNGNGNYTTYPIDDFEDETLLKLTVEEYVLLKANYYKISDDNSKLEIREKEETIEHISNRRSRRIVENEENEQ